MCVVAAPERHTFWNNIAPRFSARDLALGYVTHSFDGIVSCVKSTRPSHLAVYNNAYTCVSGRWIRRRSTSLWREWAETQFPTWVRNYGPWWHIGTSYPIADSQDNIWSASIWAVCNFLLPFVIKISISCIIGNVWLRSTIFLPWLSWQPFERTYILTFVCAIGKIQAVLLSHATIWDIPHTYSYNLIISYTRPMIGIMIRSCCCKLCSDLLLLQQPTHISVVHNMRHVETALRWRHPWFASGKNLFSCRFPAFLCNRHRSTYSTGSYYVCKYVCVCGIFVEQRQRTHTCKSVTIG